MFSLAAQPWCNQQLLSINRLASRAFFLTASNVDALLHGEHDRAECLSGEWDFYYTEHTPLDEAAFVAQCSQLTWDRLCVPRSWQMAGYGKPLYTDEDYPFPIHPPYVPSINPTGVYRRTFTVTDLDEDYILRLDGVESCASVYVNGQYVGYTQGSRLPSEFLVTDCCHPGKNELLLIVREYCDGTYLEDQDMWWLGGIIRDVWMLRRPRRRMEDVKITADYDTRTGLGRLHVEVQGAPATLTLYDAKGSVVLTGKAEQVYELPVTPWNAEEPYLYQLIVQSADECASFQVGFRRVEIVKGELHLNGRRLMLRGVNRHEFTPELGRVVTRERTKADLLLMKQAHINAVRTAHYPDNPFFYELCNELGFYVIDECDLETHGFEIEGDPDRLANDPTWEKAYLDRAERTYQRDKNHPCVIMWSLGNESFRGAHFSTMYRYFHSVDSRPVHYEGDISYVASDVMSTMYTTVGRLFERDACDPVKPMILCEFAHAMGNGPGSLREYREVIERSKHIQGYFIWEWRNHGLKRDGDDHYLHGGEVGTAYHTNNFCMDGLLNSDGTPTPGFYSFTKMNEPLRLTLEDGKLALRSVLTFRSLKNVCIDLTLSRDDHAVCHHTLSVSAVAPGETVRIALPEALLSCEENALYTLTAHATEVEFALAHEAFVLKTYEPVSAQAATISWQQIPEGFAISTKDVVFEVHLTDARIHHYTVHGREIMPLGPQLSFYRPANDNDKRRRGTWSDMHLHSISPIIEEVHLDGNTLVLRGIMGGNARMWQSPFTVAYTAFDDGHIRVKLGGRFVNIPHHGRGEWLPRIGTDSLFSADCTRFSYLGYGPGETYCDSRFQADYGWFDAQVADLGFLYDCPQENGNRTGCHAAALLDESGHGVAFLSNAPCDTAAFPGERVQLRFDYKEAGLGSASCGPEPLDAYVVHYLPYEMNWMITPVSRDNLIDTAKKAWDKLC